ncbi:uncharacterized protein LOC129634548 isoform X9 [Bubalus kerabau]|uniref:uncharacterized protein LOC129634548 isoform X9 n=1 Tax=Bubalus carabanensis TaxID=3119969 RepID=UPI00244E7C9F|nr:uncharacterized protein LOC129634548 isoform X9 [Bubalus carabanensis]
MTFPEDSCKHWTLGCTLRSSWISPGPDHYVAREIAPQRDKKDRACQNQVDLPSSAETRPGPRLPALRLVCVLSTLQWNKKGPSLQEPSRPSLLSREQTSPSLPALCLVCFLNASVEQERTEPARTKEPPCCFPSWLHQLQSHQDRRKIPFSVRSVQHLFFAGIFDDGHCDYVR